MDPLLASLTCPSHYFLAAPAAQLIVFHFCLSTIGAWFSLVEISSSSWTAFPMATQSTDSQKPVWQGRPHQETPCEWKWRVPLPAERQRQFVPQTWLIGSCWMWCDVMWCSQFFLSKSGMFKVVCYIKNYTHDVSVKNGKLLRSIILIPAPSTQR